MAQPKTRQKPQIQIFLAHASEDKPQVLKLYERLKAKGYKPWLDEKNLIPGQNWREEIPNAIKQSQIFIACLSQNSVSKQGYVTIEFRLALNKYAETPPGTIYLIPLKLHDCEAGLFHSHESK
ncbi:MAG: toll/interleukin-1 receptor domain-containing protein [Moorea sp. SIO3I7]|nr:toll/interleukin-1 receptor domain-containing protein [Moorena sp. SIO3I7]NEO08356.1 toll/interleukin-1 receptor domain-containing protein [Moorena sp. SIO3I8]